jgi:integrase
MARKRRDVPWLDTRANGVWYAFQYDAATRRTVRESLETKDSKEAQLRFARLITEGFRMSRVVGDAGITVRQALDFYLREHVKPTVVAKDRQWAAVQMLNSYFKDTPLGDVDIPMSRAYVAARLSGAIRGGVRGPRCKSRSTVRRELTVLVAAANHAARWKRIGPNAKPPTAMPQVELPAESARVEQNWLSKVQLATMFAAAEGDLSAFLRIAYYTAARRRSVERMLKSQVDLAHSVIHLDPAGAVATNKRRPPVPLYREIRPVVEHLMATDGPYLCGGTPDFYVDFKRLCAGLGFKAHPHMLRHSRATHMLMDGEDPYKVARLLGDNLTTVLKTYAHATTKYLETNSTIEEVA